MRSDALFIGVEVDEDVARDPQLAARLAEVCPVDIYATAEDGTLRIVEEISVVIPPERDITPTGPGV